MNYKVRFVSALVLLSSPFIFAQTESEQMENTAAQETESPQIFSFKYNKGDAYRILSKVHEDVLLNGKFNHHAEIVNRISVKVTGVDEAGNGVHEATFMTSEDSTTSDTSSHFTYGEEYKSVFSRSPQGIYTIGDEYFMPVVRDVPVFPETALKPGDTWSAQGHEAHDLRRTFGIEKPYKVPFNAFYSYTGDEKDENGRTFSVFSVQYNLYYTSPAKKTGAEQGGLVPAMTSGYSHQTLYWDGIKGALDHYKEEFRIIITTNTGDEITFQGTATAEVTDFEQTNTDENVKKVQDTVDKLGLKDVSVKHGDKGLTISIENIQFEPDSSELMDSEKEKLDQIAEILREYKNDLLITGHCALRGTAKERERISTERAQSVADYLTADNVRDSYHIFTRGLGASVPVASNSTEEGRAKNRRVEITLMDE